ncbi:HNH endonuclease [Candidatus Latescibacterota bacterium]
MLNSSVLLLNHNFTPLSVTNARRAVIMVWTGKAEIVETSGKFFHSVSRRFDIPSIIRLLMFVKVSYPWNLQLSKQNVIRRDRGVCQYCGNSEGPMTVDHVIPRSLGGDDNWQNLVCACPACNNRKGNRTLHQAEMELLKKPHKPTIETFFYTHKISLKSIWQPYIKG